MAKPFGIKRRPGEQNGVTYVLLFWSFLTLVTFGAFLVEGIALFSESPFSFMNNGQYFVTLALALFSLTAFLFLVHRNFRIGISWGWLIFFALLFIGNAIGTFVTDPAVSSSVTLTTIERIRFVLTFGMSCIAFYLGIVVVPKLFHNLRRLHFFFYLTILVCFVLLGYSLVREWQAYVNFFNGGELLEPRSFLNNTNTYAFALILGICACFLLHNRRSHWWWWAIATLFAITELVICSGASICVTASLFCAYVIYRFCLRVKKTTTTCVLLFLAYWIGLIVVLVLAFRGVLGPTHFLTRLADTFKSHFLHSGVLNERLRTWNIIIDSLKANPLQLIFGVGEGQGLYFLAGKQFPDGSELVYYAHSGFMQQYLNGGLFRLACYLLLFARLIYVCFGTIAKKSRVAWACLISLGAVMLHGCIESTSFLSLDMKGVAIYLLILLPLEVERFLQKTPEMKGYEDEAIGDLKKRPFVYNHSPLRLAKVAFLFVTPVVAIALSCGPMLFRMGLFGHYGTWTYYVLFIETFLFFPFVAYCLGHHADHDDRAIFGTLTFVVLVAALIAGLALAKYYPIVSYIVVGFIPLMTLFVFLLHRRSVILFREKLFLHAYLPHLLICGTLIGLSQLTLLIPAEKQSFYNAIFVGLAILAAYACCLYSRYGDELSYPICHRIHHLDCRLTARGIAKNRAIEAKQELYLARYLPGDPGKTFTVRF